MIQFNLLPDVKLAYIKATYRKRIVIFISAALSIVFLFIFIILILFVRVNQKNHIGNLDSDIKREVSKLESDQDLNKVLTIQNQLRALPDLHSQKIFTSRLFDYMVQVTPNEATINTIELDAETATMTIKGSAATLVTVNTFVDTLKFTDFKYVNEQDVKEGKAFSQVVLQNFGKSEIGVSQDGAASYTINLKYEPLIFANTAKEGQATANGVTLTVPKITTTRSETQRPANLFEATKTQQGGGQ